MVKNDSAVDKFLLKLGLIRVEKYDSKEKQFIESRTALGLSRTAYDNLESEKNLLVESNETLWDNNEGLEEKLEISNSNNEKLDNNLKQTLIKLQNTKDQYDVLVGLADEVESTNIDLMKTINQAYCEMMCGNFTRFEEPSRVKIEQRHKLYDFVDVHPKVRHSAFRIAAIPYVKQVTYVMNQGNNGSCSISIPKDNLLDVDIMHKKTAHLVKVDITAKNPLQSLIVASLVSVYLGENCAIKYEPANLEFKPTK